MNARAAARRGSALATFVSCWLWLAQVAHAGPVELFVQLAFHPDNPDVLALRYTNGGAGAFFSHDGGKSWQLMCSSAIDPAVIAAFTFGVTKDGKLLFSGQRNDSDTYPRTLWQDDGRGCGFAFVPGMEQIGLRAIAADPRDGDVLYAVSYGFGTGVENGLMRRDAKGTWTRVGPQEEALSFENLLLIKTADGVRMYAAALRKSGDADAGMQTFGPVIRVSDDGGEHWTEHAYAPPTPQTSFELEAIDPLDPDTIIASLRRPDSLGIAWKDSSDQVLISQDGGATFRTLLTLAEFGGAAFTPEGRLWIGDGGNIFDRDAPQGLTVATDTGAQLQHIADARTTCLAYHPGSDTLFACQTQSIGRIDVEDGSYEVLMRSQAAQHFVQCDGVDLPAACEMQLCGAYCGMGHFPQAPLCRAYTGPFCGPAAAAAGTIVVDAGADDAGADGGAVDAGDAGDAGPGRAQSAGGCGCELAGGGRTPHALIALLAAATALTWRRQRRL
jgi:MYXO-CTERM domain-containing protein